MGKYENKSEFCIQGKSGYGKTSLSRPKLVIELRNGNCIWAYDKDDKILIQRGKNNNTKMVNEYIPKELADEKIGELLKCSSLTKVLVNKF